MAKLEVVHGRTDHVETDSDLWALSNDRVLKNQLPWVFLSTTAHFGTLNEVSKAFKLDLKQGREKGVTHVFKSRDDQTHKLKSQELFVAGLLLLTRENGCSCVVGQLNVLAERIKSENKAALLEENSEDYKSWQKSNEGMELPYHIRLYLSHGGVNVQSGLVTREMATNLIKDLSQQTVRNIKKISGQ